MTDSSRTPVSGVPAPRYHRLRMWTGRYGTMEPRRRVVVAAAVGLVCAVAGCGSSSVGTHATTYARVATGGRQQQDLRSASPSLGPVRHSEYVFPDGAMYVYDIDHGFRLVQRVPLPGVNGVRGVVASPRTHMLYVSYGAFGGPGTIGRLLAYNLLTGKVAYNRSYDFGVDNMAIDPAGRRIYMPDGELSHDGVWNVIVARSGNVIGRINGGLGPHETIVSLSGKQVYLSGVGWPWLEVVSTATDRVIKRIGPLRGGVRPTTINGRETIAYTTASGYLGFQVSSITTGRVLFTVGFGPRFAAIGQTLTPSHGISLTPNERQLWVMDSPNGYVHVFDVSGVPQRRPRRIADIRLVHPLTGGGSGWIQMGRDGCFVYVGDSGEVISTQSLRSVAFLTALRSTKESLEIDWRNGLPVATSTRTGLGYVTRGPDPPPPKCR
jgi:DNA-binding beta-propeller fold protein YncE